MNVFAIGDLHLSFAQSKQMDVFGPQWENHERKLEENWRATVSDEDVVLMPGDLSWAMRLEEAKSDLDWLAALPGRKVLLRGNHDYWWASVSKIRKVLEGTNIDVLRNNCVRFDGVCIVGARLWKAPGLSLGSVPLQAQRPEAAEVVKKDRAAPEEDERIWRRELGRLRLSLDAVPRDADLVIAMTHFPPVNPEGEGSEAAEIIEQAGIAQCVFGHIHNVDRTLLPQFDVTRGPTRYRLVSADYLDFRPLKIA